MVPPPGGELDIDALLETARKDPAYQDLSTEELFLQVTQKLYSALKADKERAATGETQPAESNKVLQAKEWIYADCYEAYICRYKGRNYYYADNLRDKNKFCQPISLKVGINREAALIKARELYRERGSLQARGIFNKSINTKQLFDLYAKDQAYRIHKETKTGLIQESYDAKLQRLQYWLRFIESLGLKGKKIEEIPPSVGRKFKDWIYKQPKERYRDRPRDIATINAIVGATKAMYGFALKERHIGHDDTPQFEYLDAIKEDDKIKRQVLTRHEWFFLDAYMGGEAWKGDESFTPTKLARRRQFILYIRLQYLMGCRMKELDEMRWKQITEPTHLTGDAKDWNRDIYIPKSKTRRERIFTAEVTREFNILKKVQQSVGITHNDPEQRVFVKIENTPRLDEWFGREAIARFLKRMLIESGTDEELSKEFPKRHITLNSARHYFCTQAIVERKWDYMTTAAHVGNSALEIENRYSKHTANLMAAKKISSDPKYKMDVRDSDGRVDKRKTENLKRGLLHMDELGEEETTPWMENEMPMIPPHVAESLGIVGREYE